MPHSIVDQFRLACQKQNRIAMIAAFILGGFVPAATFCLVHWGVTQSVWLWLIVAGGLIFSAKTVYHWGVVAFSNAIKAFGFCVLVEGVMTFSPPSLMFLSIAGLFMLIMVNGVATGCNLALSSKEFNCARRAAAKAVKPPKAEKKPQRNKKSVRLKQPNRKRRAA